MGSLISPGPARHRHRPRRGRRRQGRPGAHRRPGPARPRPVLLRADHPRGRHPRDDLLRQRDLRPGRLGLPLPRRGRRDRARQRRASTASTPRSTARTAPRARAIAAADQVRHGQHQRGASRATFGSIDAPMGGMRESGLGRRQGSEGIHRYTEAQSVATQRLIRFAPMFGHVRRDLRQGDDRQPAADEEAGPRMSGRDALDYDVLVVGSGFGGSVTALRLTEKGYRVGVLEAGARFEDDDFADDLLRREALPVPPRGRLLRHPAHRRAQGLPDPRPARASAAARWSTPTRSTSRSPPFYDDPQWARHHRLAGRARAVLRPGQADARRRREPAPHARPTR